LNAKKKVDDLMEVAVYQLNAFTKAAKGGNPAGVVLESESLKEEEMQYIANKVGCSETAFIQKSKLADYKIRFFTSNNEVDLCGHATIATFYVMMKEKGINNGKYKIETRAGILEVSVEDDWVYLSQALPKFYQVIEKEEIIQSLNINMSDLHEELPIQCVSTGLKDILVPIKNKETLHKIHPNFERVISICKKYDVIGYHVFTLGTPPTITAHCRNFAPLYDIPEESATGTSNGALTCYLYNHNVISKITNRFIFEQGHAMNSPSIIISRLVLNEQGQISKIEVGGTAANLQIKRILV
jgi:PhzF family phenazine biosynthesis protein